MSDPKQRDSYRHFTTIATRWHDNDVYGHVNNVLYYSFFDSAVNRLLIERGHQVRLLGNEPARPGEVTIGSDDSRFGGFPVF